MGYVRALIIVMSTTTGAGGGEAQDEGLPITDVQDRTVKLLGAGFDGTRAHNMVAKFVEVKPSAGREIEVAFRPGRSPSGHTTVYRNHAATIYNIIYCSVSWRGDRRTPLTVIDWSEPLFEITFSIPKDAQGKVSDFSGWSLVSIKLKEEKKEQARPPVK